MNKPERIFRSGPIAATVWSNASEKDGKSFEYRTVSLDRSYKDRDGTWKHTSSFRVADLPRAELVVRKAFEFLVMGTEGESLES